MPRLVYALACRRAITSTDGPVSLIDVVEQISIKGAVDEETTLPGTIDLVTHWRRRPDDVNGVYELRLELLLPNGDVNREVVMAPFAIEPPHRSHRHALHIQNFPIGQEGTYMLRVAIRPAGEEGPWREVASYPIDVSHEPPGEPPASPRN